MYSNDYSAYPEIFGSVMGISAIGGSLLAFVPNNSLRRLCVRVYGLIPALLVIYVLAKEQVTDAYVIGLSVVVTLFFMAVWGLPALVSYKLVRRYRRRIARKNHNLS